MLPARYTLPDNVFVCEIGRAFVFLDVTHDRYMALNREQTAWLSGLVRIDVANSTPDKNAKSLVERLKERQLISTWPTATRPFETTVTTPPTMSIYTEVRESTHPVKSAYVWAFLISLGSTWLVEQSCGFSASINVARSWKKSLERSKRAPKHSYELLTAIFHTIAPYFVTSHDACRFRSLLLLCFLSKFGIEVDWLFGVRMSPFRAHSWIQYKDVVLNEHLETVLEYKPIMIV